MSEMEQCIHECWEEYRTRYVKSFNKSFPLPYVLFDLVITFAILPESLYFFAVLATDVPSTFLKELSFCISSCQLPSCHVTETEFEICIESWFNRRIHRHFNCVSKDCRKLLNSPRRLFPEYVSVDQDDMCLLLVQNHYREKHQQYLVNQVCKTEQLILSISSKKAKFSFFKILNGWLHFFKLILFNIFSKN
jgi:hypothetical protein